jgi:SAM-dependent methyltransferase
MSGLDFSAPALAQARGLARQTAADVEFVQAEVYDAPSVLEAGSFDFVYTGVGALCWLPKIRQWVRVVAELLVPGGWLFIREAHPLLWALAERSDELLVLEHPYFEREQPTVWEDGGTYVETDVSFQHNVTHEWNHGLGEIVTALLEAGMQLTMLAEHDSVPWEALPGRMERTAQNEWRLADRPWRLPHSYTLRAVKRA